MSVDSDIAELFRRVQALEGDNPTASLVIPKLEWAVFESNTVTSLGSGSFRVTSIALSFANGTGWSVGDSGKRIEFGDAGNYLVFANATFANSLSASKRIYLSPEPYYFNGVSWIPDAGLEHTPFQSGGPGQPFSTSGGLTLTRQAFYAFAVPSAVDAGIEWVYTEDDIANPVTWGAVTITVIRMPQT